MAVSRREILLQGSAIGAGLIAINVPGIVALAQGQPPLRRSLGDLQLNDPILQALAGFCFNCATPSRQASAHT